MDDSPLKAELQPYNHLCVKEYSNVIRNRDLASLHEERARPKPPSQNPPAEEQESQPLPAPPPQLPVEIPPTLTPSAIHHHPTPFELPPAPPEFQFDQSVGIQPGATLLNPLPFASNTGSYPRMPGNNGLGQGVIAPQMVFKHPPSPLGYQTPPTSPFTPPQHALHSQPYPHPPLMDAPAHSMPPAPGDPSAETASVETEASPDPPFPTSPSNKRKRKVKQDTERETSGADPTHVIEYDETLLAIVGILDEVKFQSNVASWVKANGLWGPHPPHNTSATNTDALTHKQVRKSSEDVATSSDSGRPGDGKKKRRDAVASFFEAAVTDEPDDVGSLGAQMNENQDQENVSEAPQWFDSPPTVRHWVNRGRKALETLGIPIEHGLRQ